MTTVAFLAETPGSATVEDQQALCSPDDFVVLAGTRSFSQLSALLAQAGSPLQAGDRVKIYDLSCLSLSTDMLVRALTKLLREGVSIEVVKPGLVIHPGDATGHILLDTLDAHYRHLHGIKTHPADAGPRGRRPAIMPEQVPAIRARMAEPGMTAAAVAKELGVGRSTLFGYLERFDRDGSDERRLDGAHQSEERGAQDAGN